MEITTELIDTICAAHKQEWRNELQQVAQAIGASIEIADLVICALKMGIPIPSLTMSVAITGILIGREIGRAEVMERQLNGQPA